MSFNPYEPPTSAYDGTYVNPASAGAVVSEAIVASLRKTRPWALLIAVLCFIYAGFIALGSLGVMFQSFGEGLIMLTFAGVAALPGVFLARYAGAINRLLHGGGVPELEQAVAAQASFWQVAGIMTLISIVLGVLAGVAAVAIGASVFNGL